MWRNWNSSCNSKYTYLLSGVGDGVQHVAVVQRLLRLEHHQLAQRALASIRHWYKCLWGAQA
jgi:hypothetical protein